MTATTTGGVVCAFAAHFLLATGILYGMWSAHGGWKEEEERYAGAFEGDGQRGQGGGEGTHGGHG